MFIFAKHAFLIIRIEKVDVEMIEVINIAKMITNEIKNIPFDKTKYRTNFDLEVTNIHF